MQLNNPFRATWAARMAGLQALAASFGIRAEGTPDERLAELQDIQAQQHRLLARSQAAIDAADREQRELTPDERHAIARRTTQIEELQARVDELDAELDKPGKRRTAADSGEPVGRGLSASAPRWGRQAAQPVLDAALPGRGRFVDLFGTPPAVGGFNSLGDFLRAVGNGDSQRLRNTATGMGELTGQDGGFLLPPGFTRDLMDASFEAETIRPRARVLPLLGRTLTAPMFTWRDRTVGPAGLVGYWANEGAALTAQTAKVAEVNFTARKLTVLVPITNELLFDAGPEAERYVKEAMGATIAAYLDRAFFLGTGAGQPLGITNGADLVTVSKEGSQTASTINFENVSKMISRLHPASFARSVWLAHPSTLPELMKLQIKIEDAAGTDFVGGTVAPIQIDASGAMSLMTRPVIISDLAAPLGSANDLLLADFSAYSIAMQPSMRFAVATEFGFDKDETYFRAVVRCDGSPIAGGTTTLRAGSDAVAHFVTLEART